MTDKPTALRLADEYYNGNWISATNQWREEAAAELRRLHLVEQALKRCKAVCDATSEGWRVDAERLTAQRDELLAALKELAWSNDSAWQADRARAVIAAVEGEKK